MSTLHLTPAEIAMFQKLPAALREGWTVEEETLTFKDDESRLRTRIDMIHANGGALAELKAMAQKAKTPEDLFAAIRTIDLSGIPDDDLGEILFAVGPDGITFMIDAGLSQAAADDDLKGIAALTETRHGLLKSLQVFAS